MRAALLLHTKQFLKDDSGQAILEFVLLMGVVIGVISLMKTSLKKTTRSLWWAMAKKISAGCASCAASKDIN